jgi:hypothetical protein
MADAVETVAQWKFATTGAASPDKDKVEFLLRAYHMKAASQTEERVRILDDLIKMCRQFVDANNMSNALYIPFIQLGMQAEKQRSVIEGAKRGMAKLQKVFGAAQNSLGATRPLQHYKQGEATPTSVKNYWLEGLDPKHRSWGHEDRALFDQWYADTATTKNFWGWLDEKGLGGGLSSVQYLAPDQRWKYMCVFGDDKIIYRHKTGDRGTGTVPLERFTTKGLWSRP